MSRAVLATAILLAALASPATSQNVSIEVSPNPVAPGGALTVTLREALGATDVGYRMGAGGGLCPPLVFNAPNGANVFCGGFATICSAAITPLAPCGTVSATVNTCPTPGTFYLRVQYTKGGVSRNEWICFTVSGGPTDPVLSATGPLTVGVPLNLDILAPSSPGLLYVGALSLTTNTGQSFGGGLTTCLDFDFVFDLSINNPLPFFLNSFGGLDGTGAATMVLNLPNVPALQCLPLHAQVLVDPFGTPTVTNALNFSIN